MSEKWQDELRAAWMELSKHAPQRRQFRTKRLSSTEVTSAYAALRAVDDAPCLLIDGSVASTSLFEVGGMRLGAYLGETGPLLALTLEDRDQTDLFVKVCGDVLASASSGSANGYLARFLARLDAWRGFLRDRRAGLSKNETIGLIGELLLLERLITISQNLLLSWIAPDDGLHDFNWKGHALEVKTSMGPASKLRISTLDQLDSAGLKHLDLIHTRLNEAGQGRCLKSIVSDITGLVGDESSRRLFANGLLKRGLMPDDRGALEYPMVEERETVAYRVNDEFPRLTRSGVPVAIADAEYSLELRSMASFAADLKAILCEYCGEAQ